MKKLLAILAFAALLLAGCMAPRAGPFKQGNHTLISDIKYSSVASDAVKLDLYLPNKTCEGKFPVIIEIHGGAFRAGDKSPPMVSGPFTENCYAVASLNYRMYPEAEFPSGNQDVKAAVRWLRAHASEYNLDAEHFGVMGGSAGGYYSAFLGTTGDTREFDVGDNPNYSSAVQAVVDEYGIGNMSSLASDRALAGLPSSGVEIDYIGCNISSPSCANALNASPINHISKSDPPFLILHGENDTQIPIKQNEDFYAALRAEGVDAQFIPVKGAGHGGPQFMDYFPQVLEFFDKHLKNK